MRYITLACFAGFLLLIIFSKMFHFSAFVLLLVPLAVYFYQGYKVLKQ